MRYYGKNMLPEYHKAHIGVKDFAFCAAFRSFSFSCMILRLTMAMRVSADRTVDTMRVFFQPQGHTISSGPSLLP